MPALVTNNATATLSAGITAVATTITLTTGQGALFPVPSGSSVFWATIVNSSNQIEVVKCTARSGDTLTVTRGQDSTTARAYSTGDKIELRPTAALFNAKLDADTASTTYAPLNSPTFTGTPSLPTGTTGVTQTAGNNSTALATTAFVTTSFAPIASPTFTGTPSLPTGTTGVTQTAGNNTTALSTTAFVTAAIAAAKPAIASTAVAANYAVAAADQSTELYNSGTFTYTLPDATTVSSGFYFWLAFNSGGFTLNTSSAQTMNCLGLPSSSAVTTITHPNTNGWANVAYFLVTKYLTNSWLVIPMGASHGSVTFTSTGTWVAPAGVTQVYVTGIGGGGAGGNASTNVNQTWSGGGGASGDIAMRQKLTVTPGTSYTVTVGTAAVASSFGALLTLAAGGAGSNNTGGAPNSTGSAGNSGTTSTNNNNIGGNGGSGLFGAGAGRGGALGTSGTAAAANTGAGGGGGGQSSGAGGSGGSGVMIVEW